MNIDFLVKNKERDLLNLPDSVVEEIIERALKLRGSTEEPHLVNFLMRMKRLPSVFDLLEIETNRVVTTYEKIVSTKLYHDPIYAGA